MLLNTRKDQVYGTPVCETRPNDFLVVTYLIILILINYDHCCKS